MTSAPLPTIKPDDLSGSVVVAGKSFRDSSQTKVFWNGVTYGPFRPNSRDEPWPEAEQLRTDLAHIASLGFNTVRIYESPSDTLLKEITAQGLRLLCGIAWSQHVDFISDIATQDVAMARVLSEAQRLSQHDCVIGLLVGNEIEKTLVRWMGPEQVRDFVEKLIRIAKEAAPRLLVSYATYPSTEYLIPRNADFVAFNVFLEQRSTFAAYIQRLQNLSGNKPLVISEFGLDTLQHGETAQAEARRWQQEEVQRAGLAGNFWFSYTDEWYRGGEDVTGWDFGLVTRDRTAKQAASLPDNPQPRTHNPKFSVVVCTRNGASTLRQCLTALRQQSHPNYEVLVIDDGSTDDTAAIAKSFDFARYHHQDHAGLSVARNLGMRLASGEIIAYTDDDCIPDEDWLHHLALAFDDPQWVAVGGPNIPPAPRSSTEIVVAAAPGAPAHVLLNDTEAEHLPGCNLAIRKPALEAIGGFRKVFTTAGDDVDVCWRLQATGGKLRFAPAAFVWHHRRFTVSAYLRQQRGYGRAEALLIKSHPDRFAWFGGARWRGAIYGNIGETTHQLEHIQFGQFGLAPFQCIYGYESQTAWTWVSGLPWIIGGSLLTLLVVSLLSVPLGLLLFALMGLASGTAAWYAMQQARFTLSSPTLSHQALLWFLCFTQPIIRDGARLMGMISLQAWPRGQMSWPWRTSIRSSSQSTRSSWQSAFWSDLGIGREEFLLKLRELAVLRQITWQEASGDHSCDAILITASGARYHLLTVTEYHTAKGRLTRIRLGPLGIGSLLSSLWNRSQMDDLMQTAARECGLKEVGIAKK